MEQKTLSKWLKLILLGVAICGLIVYVAVIPMYGLSLRSLYPEFSNRFWPWPYHFCPLSSPSLHEISPWHL